MFEDLKISKVKIDTKGIEDFWNDSNINPTAIKKLYEQNKSNSTLKFNLIISNTDLTLNDFYLTKDGYAIYTNEIEYK